MLFVLAACNELLTKFQGLCFLSCYNFELNLAILIYRVYIYIYILLLSIFGFLFLQLYLLRRLLHCSVDGASSPTEDAFLSRLMETGATESSSSNNCPEQMEEDREQIASEKTRNILHNIVIAINNLWHLKDGLYAAVLNEHPKDGIFIVESIYCKI